MNNLLCIPLLIQEEGKPKPGDLFLSKHGEFDYASYRDSKSFLNSCVKVSFILVPASLITPQIGDIVCDLASRKITSYTDDLSKEMVELQLIRKVIAVQPNIPKDLVEMWISQHLQARRAVNEAQCLITKVLNIPYDTITKVQIDYNQEVLDIINLTLSDPYISYSNPTMATYPVSIVIKSAETLIRLRPLTYPTLLTPDPALWARVSNHIHKGLPIMFSWSRGYLYWELPSNPQFTPYSSLA